MSQKLFNRIHQSNLIYNTCWEDPRLDRQALKLDADANILMITSAGCNALDYLLDSPNEIHCVDMNPAQTALLELKIAAIKTLDYEDYFQLIAKGGHPQIARLMPMLAAAMSPHSAEYWQNRISKLEQKGSIQNMGTCGLYGRLFRAYLKVLGLHRVFNQILDEPDIERSREAFDKKVTKHPAMRLGRAVMSLSRLSYLLGVPPTQLKLLEESHNVSLGNFMTNVLGDVAAYPKSDNYFYYMYLNGEYSNTAMPEYLKRENFDKLRNNIHRVIAETDDLAHYAKWRPGYFSHMVLLDHMDWLSDNPDNLHQHFHRLTSALAPDGRVIWRSAATYDGFLKVIEPAVNGGFHLNRDMAEDLHKDCRVKSYGSCFIADKLPMENVDSAAQAALA